jgi:tetratricopeptide (TPR) repeat protein
MNSVDSISFDPQLLTFCLDEGGHLHLERLGFSKATEKLKQRAFHSLYEHVIQKTDSFIQSLSELNPLTEELKSLMEKVKRIAFFTFGSPDKKKGNSLCNFDQNVIEEPLVKAFWQICPSPEVFRSEPQRGLIALYNCLSNSEKSDLFIQVFWERNATEALTLFEDLSSQTTRGGNLCQFYRELQGYIVYENGELLGQHLKEQGPQTLIEVLTQAFINNDNRILSNAKKIAENCDDESVSALIFYSLGKSCLSLQKYDDAIGYFEQELKLWQTLQNQRKQANCLINLSSAYTAKNLLGESLVLLKDALEVVEARKDRAVCCFNLGTCYYSLGQEKKAFKYFKLALRNTENDKRKVDCNLFLGDIKMSSKRTKQARLYFSSALSIAERIQDRRSQWVSLLRLGDITRRTKRKFAFYEKALNCCKAIGDKSGEASCYVSQGSAHHELGQIEQAISLYEKALKIFESFPPSKSKAHCCFKLGDAFRELGQIDHAITFYKRALEIHRVIHNKSGESLCYHNLGNSYWQLKKVEEAKKYFLKALSLYQTTKDSKNQARCYVCLGDVSADLGQIDEAIEYYNKALNIFNSVKDPKGEGNCYNSLAKVLVIQQKIKQAIIYYRKSIMQFRLAKAPRYEAKAYLNLGVLYLKQKNFYHAEKNLKKSISISSSLFNGLGSREQWKISLFDEHFQAYKVLTEVFIQQEKYEEALLVADRGRSRVLCSLISETLGLEEVPSFTIDQLLKLTKEQEVSIVYYSLGDACIHSWVIPPEGKIAYNPLKVEEQFKSEIEPFQLYRSNELVTSFRSSSSIDSLLEEMEQLSESNREAPRALNESSGAILKKLRDAYKTFIKPIEGQLPKNSQKKVLFIPDDNLYNLPFSCLLDEKDIFFIEKHPLFIAPSINAYLLLQQREEKMAKNRSFQNDSLIVGNPLTRGFSNLSNAVIEAKTVYKTLKTAYKTPKTRIFLEYEATLKSVMDAFSSAPFMHFACHGIQTDPIFFDRRLPRIEVPVKKESNSVFQGALVFSSEGEGSNLLYSEDIQAISINPELVFMSACQTGRGLRRKEGVLGLPWSFHAAGAASIVATHWNVKDNKHTIAMIDDFYRHLHGMSKETREKGKPLDKVEALQQMIVKKISRKDFRKAKSNFEFLTKSLVNTWGTFYLSGLSNPVSKYKRKEKK